MNRQRLVKILAVYLMILGLINFFNFFWQIYSDAFVNLVPFFLGFLWLGGGYDLFQLKQSGRRIAIILFSITVVFPIAFYVFHLGKGIISGDVPKFDPHVSVGYLDKIIFYSDNLFLIIIVSLALILMFIAPIVFLMQKDTKELFLPSGQITGGAEQLTG